MRGDGRLAAALGAAQGGRPRAGADGAGVLPKRGLRQGARHPACGQRGSARVLQRDWGAGPGRRRRHAVRAAAVRPFGLSLTWAWLWTGLAFALVAAGAATIAIIALSGSDGGEVALAVLLIGFPALLGALALGMLALAVARPTGAGWRSVRRWAIAFVGALAYLALDLRRGTGE